MLARLEIFAPSTCIEARKLSDADVEKLLSRLRSKFSATRDE
jgi:hypothetical protein